MVWMCSQFCHCAIKKRVVRVCMVVTDLFGVSRQQCPPIPFPYSVVMLQSSVLLHWNNIIYNNTASPEITFFITIDLKGRVHTSCVLNWDSATLRTIRGRFISQIRIMERLKESSRKTRYIKERTCPIRDGDARHITLKYLERSRY